MELWNFHYYVMWFLVIQHVEEFKVKNLINLNKKVIKERYNLKDYKLILM